MTRVRVLMKAKQLILAGYHPMGEIHGAATNQHGAIVSYSHPQAKKFTIIGAIQRAIRDTTGDDFLGRDKLFDAALDPLIERCGGISNLRNKFTTAPVEEAISLIDAQLTEWNS